MCAALSVNLQGYSKSYRDITVYEGIFFLSCILMILHILNILKFIFITEMYFKSLSIEYGMHSTYNVFTGIYK